MFKRLRPLTFCAAATAFAVPLAVPSFVPVAALVAGGALAALAAPAHGAGQHDAPRRTRAPMARPVSAEAAQTPSGAAMTDAPGAASEGAARIPPSGPVRPAARPRQVETQSARQQAAAPGVSLRPSARTFFIPKARWDHRPGGASWTRAALGALKSHGRPILDTVPRDIKDWCPAYPDAGTDVRAAFWVGLMSALAKHESTYRQTAVGGGGRWYGLLQILPATARGYKCNDPSREGLKVGTRNLSCAVRIMATTVPRDQVVSAGMRGVAADWGPFHSSRKREDMRKWVRSQEYCKTLGSIRPRARS